MSESDLIVVDRTQTMSQHSKTADGGDLMVDTHQGSLWPRWLRSLQDNLYLTVQSHLRGNIYSIT